MMKTENAVRFTLALLAWLALAPAVLALLPGGLAVPAALAAEESPHDLIERGAYRKARVIVEPRLAQPGDAEARFLMSKIALAIGDKKAALSYAEQAVAADGKSADYHLQLAQVVGRSAQDAGPLHGLSLARRFRKEAETAIALDPKQIDARSDMMEFFYVAPGVVGGDKKKAAAMAGEIAAIDPMRGALAHATLALLAKDSTTAAQDYRRAIELGPNAYEAQIAAANFAASSSQKDWTRAEALAKAALQIDPRRSGAYSLLAAIYAHAQRWSDLEALLGQAEQALPDNRVPYYMAGRTLLMESREPARAEQCFRKYLATEPEGGTPTWAHAHWRLGLVLERQGKKDAAIAELETAIKLKPDLDDAKKDLKRMKRG